MEKSSWELWWKNEIYLGKFPNHLYLWNVHSVTHAPPGQCSNPWVQNNVTYLSYSFIPCRTWTEGSGLHMYTCTHVYNNFPVNEQIMRVDVIHNLVVRDWKWNRWEIKCWNWPDPVDDCCLNSWNWNWAFYTLADAQDTICHSLDGNMDQVACHIEYQFPGNTHDPICIELEGKNTVCQKFTSDKQWRFQP